MYREFALDPALICDWASFDRFVNHFAWHKGRVLSRIPQKWEKEVTQAARSRKARPLEYSRIVEKLKLINHCFIERTGVASETSNGWYVLVKQEHHRQTLCGAISKVNPEGFSWVKKGDDFDAADPWFSPLDHPVARNATAFADALSLLLRAAKIVHFVDPHFSPTAPRFRVPFEKWLDVISGTSIFRTVSPSVFLHVTYDHKPPMPDDVKARRIASLVADIKTRLPSVVPQGMAISVYVWDSLDTTPDLHNRYILTERAGVIFGTGLDGSEHAAKDEDILRLPAANHQQRLRLFDVTAPGFTPTFTHLDHFMINGTR
jgi:hypothetical protein